MGRVRLRLVAAAVAIAVGMLDAGVSGEWDLFVIFSIAAALILSVLVSYSGRRVSLSVRADLAQRLRRRATAAGEPVEDVVDRVIASVEHGLFPDEP